jgi:hypothetical protein
MGNALRLGTAFDSASRPIIGACSAQNAVEYPFIECFFKRKMKSRSDKPEKMHQYSLVLTYRAEYD